MQRLDRADLLSQAHTIAEGYGGNLTVRQLYYQLVAQGFSPNGQKDYKRLVGTLTKARLSGAFPLDWLLDRSRTVHEGRFTSYHEDVESALSSAASEVRRLPEWLLSASRWWGQPRHVSVWVEKEALSGVFEGPCEALGVSWFACKGYPSVSSLAAWVRSVGEVVDASRHEAWRPGEMPWWPGSLGTDHVEVSGLEEVVILYFGDHDPDGWEIPRSALRNVRQLAEVQGMEMPPIRLERVALNMAQIEAMQPPPFPAKMTSARFKGYVEEHCTRDAWELDALRPNQLQRLIRSKVAALFDAEEQAKHQAHIEERRQEMRQRMQDPAWLASAVT